MLVNTKTLEESVIGGKSGITIYARNKDYIKSQLKDLRANVENASSDNKELAMHYRVQGIPNMKIFVAGEEVAELIGMKSKQTLIDALEGASKVEN